MDIDVAILSLFPGLWRRRRAVPSRLGLLDALTCVPASFAIATALVGSCDDSLISKDLLIKIDVRHAFKFQC